ncbi:MAG: hypothetical protein PHV30_10680 [Candidatus Margulisbacteria bacterium]|nr:hypothetical protein [Candidatus Margulisiibacteriota bacterium]
MKPENIRRFKSDFERYVNDLKVIKMDVTPLEAWVIMCQLQLALRHPRNIGPTAVIAREIAKEIQEKVAITPALQEIAEKGWKREFDMMNGFRQERTCIICACTDKFPCVEGCYWVLDNLCSRCVRKYNITVRQGKIEMRKRRYVN